MKRRDFLKSLLALPGISFFHRYVFAQTPGYGQRFFIPPTVMHVTENTATVFYRLTTATSTGELIVSKDNDVIQRIPLPDDHPRQQITITDLEPATVYTYRIEVDGVVPPFLNLEEAWGPLSFRTQPFEYPIRFVALGDSGFGDDITRQLAIHMAARNPDFFLHLGDVVYWSYEYNNDLWSNWAYKYYMPFRELLQRVPHYPTVGNHDREGTTLLDGQSFYYWAFPPFNEDEAYEGRRQWHSFAINEDIQFLSLNTQCFFSEPGRAEQNIWLTECLDDPQFRLTIPFFHIAFWTSSLQHAYDGQYAAETWHPEFRARADKIGALLAGHSHLYERIVRDNLTYITSGGGSATLYNHGEPIEGSQVVQAVSHYILGEIYEDHMIISAFDIDDREIDQTRIDFS